MKLTISQEGMNPITIRTAPGAVNATKSEEGVPRYNNVFFGIQNTFGTASYATIDDFLNNNREKIKKWTDALKQYCDRKNWELLDQHTASGLHTTFWTWLNKDTTAKVRAKAVTETWRNVNGVPIVFLEFNRGISNGVGAIYVVDAHIFCRKKDGSDKFFTKKVISNLTLAAERTRR